MDQTIAAVKKFQEYNGLPIDADMDEETWNQLFNAGDVVDVNATPRPSPEPTLPPYYVVVDVTNQVTKVYSLDENNEYTVLERQMICSTGVKGWDSDLGDAGPAGAISPNGAATRSTGRASMRISPSTA